MGLRLIWGRRLDMSNCCVPFAMLWLPLGTWFSSPDFSAETSKEQGGGRRHWARLPVRMGLMQACQGIDVGNRSRIHFGALGTAQHEFYFTLKWIPQRAHGNLLLKHLAHHLLKGLVDLHRASRSTSQYRDDFGFGGDYESMKARNPIMVRMDFARSIPSP